MLFGALLQFQPQHDAPQAWTPTPASLHLRRDFKGVVIFGSVRSGKIISFTFIWDISVLSNFIISFDSQNNSLRISTYYYYAHVIQKGTKTKIRYVTCPNSHIL